MYACTYTGALIAEAELARVQQQLGAWTNANATSKAENEALREQVSSLKLAQSTYILIHIYIHMYMSMYIHIYTCTCTCTQVASLKLAQSTAKAESDEAMRRLKLRAEQAEANDVLLQPKLCTLE